MNLYFKLSFSMVFTLDATTSLLSLLTFEANFLISVVNTFYKVHY